MSLTLTQWQKVNRENKFDEYTDYDENQYKLIPRNYTPDTAICQGCSFKFHYSERCRLAKPCTPTDHNGKRLTKDPMNIWVPVQVELF